MARKVKADPAPGPVPPPDPPPRWPSEALAAVPGLTPAEALFTEAMSHLQTLGLTPERMLALVWRLWAGQPSGLQSEGAGPRQLRLTARPDGDGVVVWEWGPMKEERSALSTRAFAAHAEATAETAETAAYLRDYFSRARDQNVAQTILRQLLIGLAKNRAGRAAAWLANGLDDLKREMGVCDVPTGKGSGVPAGSGDPGQGAAPGGAGGMPGVRPADDAQAESAVQVP